jgi:hypothetical protein
LEPSFNRLNVSSRKNLTKLESWLRTAIDTTLFGLGMAVSIAILTKEVTYRKTCNRSPPVVEVPL